MTVLKTSTEDTLKVTALINLSERLSKISDFGEPEQYAIKAVELAQKLNFSKGISSAYRTIGNIYKQQGNYSEALKNFQSFLENSQETSDKDGMASAFGDIGLINWIQGDHPEALKNHMAALKICEELGNKIGIAACYSNIGIIYDLQHQFDEALKNYLAALNIAEELNDKYGIAVCKTNIGLNYLYYQSKYPEALVYYLGALEIWEELGEKLGIAEAYTSIGTVYQYQGNYDEALKYHLASLKMTEEFGNKSAAAFTCLNIGKVYTDLKKYAIAEQYLIKALSLANEIGEMDRLVDTYYYLSKLYEAMGNFKQAFKYYEEYISHRDINFNETNSRVIAQLKEQYESEKKENEIILLNKNNQLQISEIKKQKLLKNSLIGGIILIIFLVIIGYRSYRTKQLLKLQALRNKIASDLHDEVGSTLSSIALFSDVAREQSNEVMPMLQSIGDNSRRMLESMADIVWTINPANDSFEKIILRMRSFAFELLGAKNIDFNFKTDETVSRMKLSMEARKNLYLIFKEAINNIAKYSEADRASFSITGSKSQLNMLIRDNGKGFDVNRETSGNGLNNMRMRALEIGAQLIIESGSGIGTTIQLKL